MAPSTRAIASLALFTAILLFARAPRLDRWTITGPGGGGGHFIPTISPHDANRVLVACDMTGSFISHDAGASWRMFNLGNRTDVFAFDPRQRDVIYAKTAGPPAVMVQDRPLALAGLFRSADAGKTWRLVRADPPAGASGELMTLTVDPGDSKVLYAVLQEGKAEALHISRDAGRTWQRAADLPAGGQNIYVDPRSPAGDRTLYVAGSHAVAVRAGGRWSTGEAIPPLPAGVRGPQRPVFSAGFPAESGPPVFYATNGVTAFVSEDGARTWRVAEIPEPSVRFRAVATSLGHPGVAYLSYGGDAVHGVAKTVDRGRTWSLVWKETNQPGLNIQDAWLTGKFGPRWGGSPGQLGVAPGNPDICYGTDSGRTMRTLDGGKTWQGVYSKAQEPGKTWTSTGLDVTTAYGVHFDPFDARRMFISYTDIGLFGSEDGGTSWAAATTGVPRTWTNTTYWIAFDPEVRGRVWGAMAGAHDLPRPKMWLGRPALRYPGGVCRSEDGGRTWKVSNQGMPETATTHVLVDPKSPRDARVLYATGFATGVYKSIDGGANWMLKNTGIAGKEPFAWRLTMDAAGALYLVVARRADDGRIGSDGDGALYRSTDGAESWTRLTLPAGVNGPHGLSIDPRDPKRMYLAAWGRRPERETIGGGIFVTSDGGASWKHALAKDQHIYDITIDPADARVLYASGFGSSAWRSADRGATWKRLGGFNFKWGHRVTPDPLDRAKIYVTTYGGSVWHGPALGDPGAAEDVVAR